MWDLPRPGIELVSPALAGRLLAPVAPGKSSASLLWFSYFDIWPCWLLLEGKRVEDCVGFRHMSLRPTSHPLEFSHMPQTIWNEPGKYLPMAHVCKERRWWRHHIALCATWPPTHVLLWPFRSSLVVLYKYPQSAPKEFQYILSFFFNFLAVLWGMWDPSSWPGMEPVSPVLEAWSLNHWTAREVPKFQHILTIKSHTFSHDLQCCLVWLFLS